MELFRKAPVGQIWHCQLRRRDRADPVRRPQAIGRLALRPPPADELARVDRRGVRHVDAQLVVLEEHDVVRLREGAAPDELRPDGHEHEPEVCIGSLVYVEVVVGRERRHQKVDVV